MPHIRKRTVDPTMYRHFAVITIALTLTLGIFADGEGRQAVANGVSREIAERQESRRVQEAQVAKFGKAELIRRSPAKSRGASGGDSDGFDPHYGQPSDRAGSLSGSGAVWTGRINPSAKIPGAYAPYGIPQAQWDAMSEEERAAILANGPRSQPVSAAQHRRDVAGLMAASAARAGEAGEE